MIVFNKSIQDVVVMSKEELIKKTDDAITELVYDKWELQRAYNYYNGKMDADQFRYIEENFGIGNPTAVEFIPLIRKHIDALIGEYLGTPILPKVTCKDSETISKITREKQLSIFTQVLDFLQKRLQNKLMESFSNGEDKLTDPAIKQDLTNLVEDLDYGFESQYEMAAQNVIEYLLQSRETDIKTKLKTILLDLLVSGWTFYQCKPTVGNNNVKIEVHSPLNTFIDRNPNSPYVKDSYRAVIRRWMTESQILNEYGDRLSKTDRTELKEACDHAFDGSSAWYIRSYQNADGTPQTDGLRGGEEVTIPGYPNTDYRGFYNNKLIPVYEVEWLETDKDFVMQRYKTFRIGDDIYILEGKDDSVVRSHDNPRYCSLTLNGLYFTNRNSEPYSIVLACASLQDKYNLLHFYRDNLIASSGTTGDFIDVSVLPKFLGVNLPERLQKWLTYKKQGTALIDTSQEGRLGAQSAPINTIYNGFDDTVKAQAVQAIQIAIDATEQTCSSITGVFRERLNGIQQRDAVTNVQTSVNNSYIISRQWYQQMDCIVEEMLLDALNEAKVVYKNGLTGTIILGDKQVRVFTALPEHFTMTDYDVHITNSQDIVKDTEQLRALVPEFIKAGQMDPESIIDLATSKSITSIKTNMHKSMRKQKQENNQIQQLMQQLEEAQQQLKQTQQELEKVSHKAEQLNEAKLQLEKEKIQKEYEIKLFQSRTDRDYKENVAKNDNKRTEIELLQLSDGNPYNDKVRQMSTY